MREHAGPKRKAVEFVTFIVANQKRFYEEKKGIKDVCQFQMIPKRNDKGLRCDPENNYKDLSGLRILIFFKIRIRLLGMKQIGPEHS